jgi:hypothetical protein
MITYSGDLIVEYAGSAYQDVANQNAFWNIHGYELEPLFKSFQLTPLFDPKKIGNNWFIARQRRFREGNPWEIAHSVAAIGEYSFYVEPDLMSESLRAIAPTQGLNPDWPPPSPVSPGWHLQRGFTDFTSASVKGAGIRIAHLDTGWWTHWSRPKNLSTSLGCNFLEGNSNTTDLGYGSSFPPGGGETLGAMPGHGMATLALLSGNKAPGGMVNGGQRFNVEIGGLQKQK